MPDRPSEGFGSLATEAYKRSGRISLGMLKLPLRMWVDRMEHYPCKNCKPFAPVEPTGPYRGVPWSITICKPTRDQVSSLSVGCLRMSV